MHGILRLHRRHSFPTGLRTDAPPGAVAPCTSSCPSSSGAVVSQRADFCRGLYGSAECEGRASFFAPIPKRPATDCRSAHSPFTARHVQRREGEMAVNVPTGCPAHHSPREEVENHREIQPSVARNELRPCRTGHFYLAETRTFLLSLDTGAEESVLEIPILMR